MDWGGELGGPSPNLALPAPTADYLALHPLTKEFIHRKKKNRKLTDVLQFMEWKLLSYFLRENLSKCQHLYMI